MSAGATVASAQAGEEFRNQGPQGLPPDVIRRLSRLSPVRSTLALMQVALLIVASAALATVWWNPLTVLIAIVGMAGAQHALMVLAHDAAHYRLYDVRWLNDGIGRCIGGVVGISMPSYRVVHRLHHNHLYETVDPDLALMAGYPRGRAYLIKRLLRDLTGITAYKNYAYFFGAPARNSETGTTSRPLDDTSPRLRRAALRDRWFVAGLQAAMLGAAIAGGWWVGYLVLWVLPLLTLLQALLRLRAVAEHGAVHDLTSPLTAARTVLPPRWIAWLLFPAHVHYHIEHHLYPAIPHYRLAEAHRLLTENGTLAGAEVASLSETLSRIFADRPARAAA